MNLCKTCGKECKRIYCSRQCYHRTPAVRLMERVHYREDGCIDWLGPISKTTGYGRMKAWGKFMSVHRVSYIVNIGPIPEGMHVLHTCIGNRRCINHKHLYLGDELQNAKDRVDQGRNGDRRGAKSGSNKLTDEAVAKILATPRTFGMRNKLAAEFNVHPTSIYRVWNRKTWQNIPT